MPLIDVSLLFTPISLMICVTSFSGTWVESHESLMSCRGWWAVSDAGCVLQSLQWGADCRLQAPLQAGVSRTRDTVATATHWRPCPREWLAPGDRGNNQYQSLNPHLNCQILNLSIGLALLISLLYSLPLKTWIFTRGCHRQCTERREGQVQSRAQTRGVSPVSSEDWPGQWAPARYGQCPVCHCHHHHTHCVSIKIIQLITRQECVSNGQKVIVKPGLVSNSRSQYWYRDRATHSETHGPGSRRLLLFYAKIMHEGLASETNRQASARETNVNWINSSNLKIDFVRYNILVNIK